MEHISITAMEMKKKKIIRNTPKANNHTDAGKKTMLLPPFGGR
jgi:hypothetical protein